ncbi:GGDEF domain-containing protein [uncultured Sphingomonas sp.]|uniref:GGDEF domain-containing protein n=1 Tax=uncultured Sphingomonas sp. TaxID=158754 RepID=UPI00258687EE|nr:GGDEF domain-containing protein [uncultured Sphingomonas sp.]
MDYQRQARLSGNNPILAWLADPVVKVPDTARPMLYACALSAPSVVVMAALTGISIGVAAALRTGQPIFWLVFAAELILLTLRLEALRQARHAYRAGARPTIERSMRLSLGWCALQGLSAFVITRTGDVVLMTLATAFVLGLVAPICARNYAMPRMATLMMILCDLPLKIGLAMSREPLLWLLLPMTVPLFIGVCALLGNFGRILANSLEAAEHNRHLAGHDPLTGLVNRHGLNEVLARFDDRSIEPVALVCIDLDGFKPVNDRYGHAAGDAVLVEVAQRLRQASPDQAFIARLGGDEFMVAVRHLPPEAAAALAERIRETLSSPPYRIAPDMVAPVTASVGYACLPEDAASVDQLRHHADAALYASKRTGRAFRYEDSLGRIDDAA